MMVSSVYFLFIAYETLKLKVTQHLSVNKFFPNFLVYQVVNPVSDGFAAMSA